MGRTSSSSTWMALTATGVTHHTAGWAWVWPFCTVERSAQDPSWNSTQPRRSSCSSESRMADRAASTTRAALRVTDARVNRSPVVMLLGPGGLVRVAGRLVRATSIGWCVPPPPCGRRPFDGGPQRLCSAGV